MTAKARTWQQKQPGDVLALIGLGDALEAKRDLETAARAYGSIIDLYPARADFRRFAGERLERLGKAQRALIIDTYRRAFGPPRSSGRANQMDPSSSAITTGKTNTAAPL